MAIPDEILAPASQVPGEARARLAPSWTTSRRIMSRSGAGGSRPRR